MSIETGGGGHWDARIPSDVRVTVCMATHNGAPYVAEQMISILANLSEHDEVAVVDDASTDSTVEILRSFRDPRVRLSRNDRNLGHVRTFERAMETAKGRYILLADQDDVWLPGRVESMVGHLLDCDVVASNFEEFGASSRNRLPRISSRDSGKWFANLCAIFLGNRAYFGSTMGFRAEALRWILPIPSYVEAHDIWIALGGHLNGRVGHMDEASLLRRLHGSNLTARRRRSGLQIARSRVLLARQVIELVRRGTSGGA